jgi:hypothetical protein
VRPAALTLAAAAALSACTPEEKPQCPFDRVATLAFASSLALAGDPALAGLDPVPALPDCTPDPLDPAAAIRYPASLPAWDASLTADPETGAAALCRANGVVLLGDRSASGRYSVEVDSDSAILCSSACVATLRVVVAGDVALDGGGAPAGFDGILVEVLTAERGACDACLPPVAGADPPARACAARYALHGTLR